MKYIVLMLFVCIRLSGFAQQTKLIVFIQDEVVSVNLAENNTGKLFTINTAHFSDNDLLRIRVQSDSIDNKRKRDFFIYNKEGNTLKDFLKLTDGTYSIRFADIKKMLKPGKEYFIYTAILPTNSSRRKLRSIEKNLVCTIKTL